MSKRHFASAKKYEAPTTISLKETFHSILTVEAAFIAKL
jgi:hypothetical protein